jgi:hypothetical protein
VTHEKFEQEDAVEVVMMVHRERTPFDDIMNWVVG